MGPSEQLRFYQNENDFHNFLKSKNHTVVVFGDYRYYLSFMDFGMYKYQDEIAFGLAPSKFAENYTCPSLPCFAAFENEKQIPLHNPPARVVDFARWCSRVLNWKFIELKSLDDIRTLFNEKGTHVFAIDYEVGPELDEAIKDIPENVSINIAQSELFSALFLPVSKGIYVYRASDRMLLPLNESNTFADLKKSPFIKPDPNSIKEKEYFAAFIIGDDDTYVKIGQQCYDTLVSLVKKFSDKIGFALLAGPTKYYFTKQGKLNSAKEPYFVVFNSSHVTNDRWLVLHHNISDVQYYEDFLQRIVDKKEDYTLISKKEPNQPENEVFKEVVASTFKHYIIENENDTLCVITAPWCGHCKHFKPILKETAQDLVGLPYNIFWFDGTENENSMFPEFKGYPTMYLFPAGKKDSPIEFSGERTVEGVKDFLSKNATIKLQLNTTDNNSTKSE